MIISIMNNGKPLSIESILISVRFQNETSGSLSKDLKQATVNPVTLLIMYNKIQRFVYLKK